MLKLKSKTAKILYAIIASIIIHFIWRNSIIVIDFLDISRTTVLGQSIRAILLTLAVFVFTAVVINPKEIFSFLGLNRNILKGFGIALICVLPIYFIFTIFGKFANDISLFRIYHKCIIAGFTEELVCRAFMFGLLFRYAKSGFFWAILLPALYFGSQHLYQGHDIISSLFAFGVTFIGALYFSWMYAEWNFNLWVPIGLHIFMNLAWFIFSMEGTENAAGGLISNIARVISILLAVGITVWHKRKNESKIFSYPVWQF